MRISLFFLLAPTATPLHPVRPAGMTAPARVPTVCINLRRVIMALVMHELRPQFNTNNLAFTNRLFIVSAAGVCTT